MTHLCRDLLLAAETYRKKRKKYTHITPLPALAFPLTHAMLKRNGKQEEEENPAFYLADLFAFPHRYRPSGSLPSLLGLHPPTHNSASGAPITHTCTTCLEEEGKKKKRWWRLYMVAPAGVAPSTSRMAVSATL